MLFSIFELTTSTQLAIDDMATVFISGLTPGNGEKQRDLREGTMVAIMDFERWSSGDRAESVLAIGVSNEEGVFACEIDEIMEPIGIRVHIREFGFQYLGFNAELGPEGFFYAARLEPDTVIRKEDLDERYPNSVREEWDVDAEHLKAQQLIHSFRNQTDTRANLLSRLAEAARFLRSPSPRMARRSAFLSYSHEPDNDGHSEWVENLADDLVRNGVDIHADFYAIHGGMSITDFMNSMSGQDKIILILTPNYKVRALEGRGGVGYEYRIVSNTLLDEGPQANLIPVVRIGDKATSVPEPIGDLAYIDCCDDGEYESKLDEIVKAVYEKPRRRKPEIGQPPEE